MLKFILSLIIGLLIVSILSCIVALVYYYPKPFLYSFFGCVVVFVSHITGKRYATIIVDAWTSSKEHKENINKDGEYKVEKQSFQRISKKINLNDFVVDEIKDINEIDEMEED